MAFGWLRLARWVVSAVRRIRLRMTRQLRALSRRLRPVFAAGVVIVLGLLAACTIGWAP